MINDQVEFINESGLEFKSLDSEEYRIYEFPGTNNPDSALLHGAAPGVQVRIDAPQKLHVSASGGHRIFDAYGTCHYIPAGWVHLSWRVKPGRAHFDF